MPRQRAAAAIKLPRVIFITGKGGAGKSSIATALAWAIARRSRVTLVELDPDHASAFLDSTSPAGDKLTLINLAPRASLEAFVERIVPLKAISRRMLQSRTFGFVTAALPGLEAFLMLDRLRRIAHEANPEETIVVDAPATGGALEMLAVAQGVGAIAPLGTLHELAGELETFLRSPGGFGVMITLRPGELSLRETIAAAKSLAAIGVECAGAILNGVTSALFSAAEIAALDTLPDHRALAQERRAQAETAIRVQRELRRCGLPILATPTFYRPKLEPEDLATLADLFARQLLK
jgi:arsenite-transporting ATPase